MTPSSEAICYTSLPIAGRAVLLGTHGNGGTAANRTLAGLFLFVAVFLRSQWEVESVRWEQASKGIALW
jgi:hypothetical protein